MLTFIYSALPQAEGASQLQQQYMIQMKLGHASILDTLKSNLSMPVSAGTTTIKLTCSRGQGDQTTDHIH